MYIAIKNIMNKNSFICTLNIKIGCYLYILLSSNHIKRVKSGVVSLFATSNSNIKKNYFF